MIPGTYTGRARVSCRCDGLSRRIMGVIEAMTQMSRKRSMIPVGWGVGADLGAVGHRWGL